MAELSVQQLYYQEMLAQLALPFRTFDWQLAGFSHWVRKTMRAYIDAEFNEEENETGENLSIERAAEKESIRELGFIPDAFCIDEKNRMAYVLEIVETSDITDLKARALTSCFWDLDSAEWQLAVVLLYPKYARTMLVWDLHCLDSVANKLGSRPNPYRDSFTTLRRDVTNGMPGGCENSKEAVFAAMLGLRPMCGVWPRQREAIA